MIPKHLPEGADFILKCGFTMWGSMFNSKIRAKMIKSIIKNIMTLGVLGILVSCDNEFLGRPESTDVTVEDIFAERAQAESFLWETYRTCMPLGFPIDWGLHVFLDVDGGV